MHIPKIDIQDRPHDDIDMLFELAFLSLETASKNYYPFTIPHAVGLNRAVWSDSCQNRIHLESSICSAKHHMYAGYMRLWRSDLSDPHTASCPWPSWIMKVSSTTCRLTKALAKFASWSDPVLVLIECW